MYYRSLPGQSAELVDQPKPLLLMPDGIRCGELPYSFPDDPPAEIQVRFLDWRSGFPWRIDIAVKDPTASGDRRLRKTWDARRKFYLNQEARSDE